MLPTSERMKSTSISCPGFAMALIARYSSSKARSELANVCASRPSPATLKYSRISSSLGSSATSIDMKYTGQCGQPAKRRHESYLLGLIERIANFNRIDRRLLNSARDDTGHG